ncbi:MAG: tRNA-intron lyase [Nitrososphaerales archaeon]
MAEQGQNSSQVNTEQRAVEQEHFKAHVSKAKHVVLDNEKDALLLESRGFGIREGDLYYLKDYEALYLVYTNKLEIKINGKSFSFKEYLHDAETRDKESLARFLIFRDLRTRGYVVREGFGFPIDFRVYERGDYGTKAAKYIVFGLSEGKTLGISELKKNIEEMSIMGKEAVVAVVERRGEVIYYKVGKWHPVKPL